MKLKTNCSIVRLFGCGRLVRRAIAAALCAAGLSAAQVATADAVSAKEYGVFTGELEGGGTLCFTAEKNGSTVAMRSNGSGWTLPKVQYKTEGSDWQDFVIGSTSVTLENAGDKVWFRGDNPDGFSADSSKYVNFTMTGSIAASGSVMSLVDPTLNTSVIPCDFCFYSLFFNCKSLTKAPALPATTLADSCYGEMFRACTSLTNAPALPAKTLADSCYYKMFSSCMSLTEAPALPATTLADSCYYQMFDGCESLTEAPALPAKTLADSCYYQMFNGCTSLTTATAELPAKTLANKCCYQMFYGCTSLTNAPAELPATTLAQSCYYSMFQDCTSLTEAPALPATTLAQSCYKQMFDGCTSLTEAPALPATTLADECYSYMFQMCTSLTNAPALPATTLAQSCYYSMFQGCTSLTNAPALPATTLADSCYYYMFRACTLLMNAPALPATTLADSCYRSMFMGCTSLTNAPALPATTLADSCYLSMFYGCMSLTEAPALPAKTLADECYYSMFQKCTLLTTAPTLPATTLADSCYYQMFDGCTSLTNAPALPATTLADSCYYYMFRACTSLTEAPALPATTLAQSCYYSMFDGCTSLTNAPALPAATLAQSCYGSIFYGCTSLTEAPALPATTLADKCYHNMFSGCTSLTEAPALPATTLAQSCYKQMFDGCTSLTNAPALPATTLADSCYSRMFQKCTSLTNAPALPATTLADSCYSYMFSACTSLTEAPALPATTLAASCYSYMFYGCTSLTNAPALPATTLADKCYSNMFNGCSKLNQISVGFSAWSPDNATGSWAKGVADKGTFVCPAALDDTEQSVSRVPKGWIVERKALVTLPTDVPGCTYVVSNLTAGAEIEPIDAGGATYVLPVGAKVGVYAVIADGYLLDGTNPHVIEEVTEATTVDAAKLPTAEKGTAVGEKAYALAKDGHCTIFGAGTVTALADVAGLKDLLAGLTAINVTSDDVTGAVSDAFQGIGNITLTLPDGWQGELPDEGGNWYGATGVTLTAVPLAVKNVAFQQRYPWNGKVDIGFGVTGPEGETNVVVTAYTNGTVKIASYVAAVTIPASGVLATNLVWDADAAGLGANFKSDDVTVEVALEGGSAGPSAVQLWENGPYFAECNIGATKPEGYGILTNFNDAAEAVTAAMGTEWSVPTAEELKKLARKNTGDKVCSNVWTTCNGVAGRRFFGMTSGYEDKSIFLPAAGYVEGGVRTYAEEMGVYWSSEADDDSSALNLNIREDSVYIDSISSNLDMSVRAVRDTPPAPAGPAISAKSEVGALDLTAGDRVAKDAETIVVDPAWGKAATATVKLLNGWQRNYTCASNDTWDTTALTPGRYRLAFYASAEAFYGANFWKIGDDWVVFDGSNITAGATFETGKTYLMLGTNMVNGTLTVTDRAKFEYGPGAGFLGGTVAELPKRYEQKTVEGGLYQIVEKIKGCADNPWEVGGTGGMPPEYVEAWTNGTELVIGGKGTVTALADVAGLKDLLAGLTAINVTSDDVTGAVSDAFQGIGNITLTLPDGWQGELPDEGGNWYGATGVTLTAVPLAVKNVTFQQRYPWNGLVDIGFGVTGPAGEKSVVITVRDGESAVTNFTAAVTVDEGGVFATNLVWDATTGLAANFQSDNVTVEVTLATPPQPGQLWKGGPIFAECNVGASKPEEYGYYFWWGDTVGYTNNSSAWVSVKDGTTSIQFSDSDPTATNTYKKTIDVLMSEGWIDVNTNLVAAHDAATAHLGEPWRMMTKAELDELDKCPRTAINTEGTEFKNNGDTFAGYRVSGQGNYSANSIFLPAAGFGKFSSFENAGTYGFYWASTAKEFLNASYFYFTTSSFKVTTTTRYLGFTVRAVRDAAPQIVASDIKAKSEAGTVDLRTAVTLAGGAVTVAGVAWSATAWGEEPETNVTLGYMNRTTRATGTLATGLSGSGAADVHLPKKNGDYRLTHSTGDLTSCVKFTVTGYPLGCETNPWTVGPEDNPDGTVAWTDGNGNVYFKPPRSAVSRTGLETVTNAMGGVSFEMWLVSADGTATNGVKMIVGASGAQYDSLAEALEAGEDTCTLFDVKGCVVNYDGMGHSGTMAPDTFLPNAPTNLTANAFTAFGYTFQGWTTNGADGVVFADRARIADPQAGTVYDLKAVWEFVPVSVGRGVTAYLDGEGTLHIMGNGKVRDFTEADPAPWAGFAADIKAIEVAEGVTKVGNAAFEALDYATTETLTFQDDEHELNPLAFVSADGSVTNAPATAQFRVVKSGTAETAAAFGPKDSLRFAPSIADSLSYFGTTPVQVLTLADVVNRDKDYLTDIAGDKPYSRAMQKLLDEAFQKLGEAKSLSDIATFEATYFGKIEAQAEKDKNHEIEGMDITWRVMDGTLVIEGEGEMPDFVAPDYPEGAPWNEMKADITNATVAAGITSVGDAAFAVCPAFAESSVLFKDPEAVLNLGAFVSGDKSVTNVPTVKVEIVTEDGRKLRVIPGGWTDAYHPYVTYDSLEEALEDGAVDVVAAFAKETDEGEKTVPPTEVEEVVKTVTDGDGNEIELTAKYENIPTAEGSTAGLVTEIENLPLIVDNTGSNITVVVTATNKAEVAISVVQEMDGAMSNDCEIVKAILAPDVRTENFDSSYLDMSAFFSFKNDSGRLVEFTKSIIAHIPMKLYDGQIYSVSRQHNGVTEVLPMWYAGIDDDEDVAATNEWVKADVANQELVVKTRRFCDYALGTLELEKSCTIYVNNGSKALGEADPPSLATNFQIRVTGALNASDFAGYCKRTKGEAVGDYAINFVCTKRPQGYDGELVVLPGVFTIREPEMLEGSGTVKYPTIDKKTGFLKEKANASWTATPAMGCVFAGWAAADGAPECVTSNLVKFSENELKNKKLTFKVGEGEQVAPTDVAATWARIDEDVIEGVSFATNAAGEVVALDVKTLSYVTATVSGLPSGLRFNAKTLAITGAVKAKDKTYNVKVSVKNASGYTWKQTFGFTVVNNAVTEVVPADDLVTTGVPVMLWCDPAMGKVTGTGVVALSFDKKTGVWSKKVAISATAMSGYVFAGWYEDPGFAKPAEFWTGTGASAKPKDYREVSQSITVTGPTYLFARFVEKTTKADPITWLRYAGAGYCGADASWLAEEETWYQGVALPSNACQIAFGSASLPTVTVSGLPSGVKFDKTTCRFTGVPTACSTEKKPFFVVKVSVKNKSGATDVLTKNVYVEPLPAWAVGNFDGYHMEDGATNGTFAATVGKTGKVSGKTKGGWADTTFSAKNFSEVFTWDGTNLIYAVDVTVSYRDPETKKTVKQDDTLYLMENTETHLGTIGGGDADGNGCMGIQGAWDRKTDASIGFTAFPAFATGKKTPTLELDGITLKFGAKGKVTVSGKVTGDNGNLVTVSGSTYVLPLVWTDEGKTNLLAQVCVYVAPNKNLADGICEVYDILLTVGEDGNFDTVSVADAVHFRQLRKSSR